MIAHAGRVPLEEMLPAIDQRRWRSPSQRIRQRDVTSWCRVAAMPPACRLVSPVVEQIGREYAGRLKVVKLNIDEAPTIATRYAIQGIPQLVVIKDGQEADRLVDAVSPAQLRAMIERHVMAVAAPPGVSG